MPEFRTVYFAPDGKWFETRDECERHEQVVEISEWIRPLTTTELMVEKLLTRYKVEERYDFIRTDEGEKA